MVTRAALQAESPPDADPGIAAGDLTLWRERCLGWQRDDLDRAFASFTFVADVTTLAGHCHFAGDGQTLVARYDGLPFAAIAFHSLSETRENRSTSRRVAALTRHLVAPGEPFVCLVAERDRPVLRAAYKVLKIYPEWQMAFTADVPKAVAGDAVRLREPDLPAMRALARRESMSAFERDPLVRGPWYGVWRDGRLIAQAGTHLLLERAAEIGNVVTAAAYRRQGYGSRVVTALLQELGGQGYVVFLHVLKKNKRALVFYEKLGFERRRTMILSRCCV
jgi:GNAT superfamily N-acetyltransferase